MTLAADDISSVFYPRVKVSVGADGSATDLDGTSARGAYVDPRLLLVRKQATPTVSTSPAYTAGDAVGGLLTFSSAVRASGGTCYLESATVLDKAKQTAAGLELWLFDRTFTNTADNAAFDVSDSDLANCLGMIEFAAGDGASTSTTATLYTWPQSVGIGPYPLVLNGTDLFGQLVTRGTPTFASTSDIVISLMLRQN